ncbi:MAG: MlaD family protein [Kiritimatiellae bacterium]|nr:MlaD family protein [Kiritimatiellia bacterium]
MNDARTRCLNRELTKEMIVGTFIGSVFIVLVVFTVVISGSRILQGGTHKMQVTFDKVGGLRRHDSVLVRGVPVGKVDRLKLSNEGVLVTLSLREHVELHQDYRIKVLHASLLGGMQLIIEEGAGAPLPEGSRLRGLPPDNVMEDLGGLVRDVRGALSEGGLINNLQASAADLAELTGRLRRGEGSLGKLLSTNDTVYTDLQTALASVRKIAERLERGEGTLGKLLSADDTVYRDLQASLSDVRVMADRLERGEGTLGKMMSTNDTVYAELESALANVRKISDRLERGEGTLGKLLSADDTLYRDLSATAASLRAVTGRIEAGEGLLGQLMSKDSPLAGEIEGLVKDTRDTIDDFRDASPITTFTSIFFGVF